MKASFFGKADWLEILIDKHPDHLKSLKPEDLKTICENVIKSDNHEACAVCFRIFFDIFLQEEMKKLALSRGKRKVLEELKINKIKIIKMDVYRNVIKSEEF